jgi:hypothetical protein
MITESDEFRNTGTASADIEDSLKKILIYAYNPNNKDVPILTTDTELSFQSLILDSLDPAWIFISLLEAIRNLKEDFNQHRANLNNKGVQIHHKRLKKIIEVSERIILDEFMGRLKEKLEHGTEQSEQSEDETLPEKRLGDSLLEIRDLTREMVADFSMLYALSRIEQSLINQASISQSDVDYTFGCIIEQSVSWLPATVPEGETIDQTTTLRDIIYRWIVQKCMVYYVYKDSNKTWSQWENDSIDEITFSICLFDKRVAVDNNRKTAVKAFVKECLGDLKEASFAHGEKPCLAQLLAKTFMLKQQQINTDFLKSKPAHDILDEFYKLWESAKRFSIRNRMLLQKAAEKNPSSKTFEEYQGVDIQSSDELEHLRTKFAWTLWSKSQKLCFDNCFEVA